MNRSYLEKLNINEREKLLFQLFELSNEEIEEIKTLMSDINQEWYSLCSKYEYPVETFSNDYISFFKKWFQYRGFDEMEYYLGNLEEYFENDYWRYS